jgi:periplasmic protein TonB
MRIIIIYNLHMLTSRTLNLIAASFSQQLGARGSRSAIIFAFVLVSHGLFLAVILMFHKTENPPRQTPSELTTIFMNVSVPSSDSATKWLIKPKRVASQNTATSTTAQKSQKINHDYVPEKVELDGAQNGLTPAFSADRAHATSESTTTDQKADANQSAGEQHAVNSPPQVDVHYLNNPAPQYPSLSRRAGEEGKVVLQVLVEASGLPSKVSVSTSSGYERLDRAAVVAVSHWKFVAARRGQTLVPAWVLVPVVFSLKV